MPARTFPRPSPDECSPSHRGYVESVVGDDARPALVAQVEEIERVLGSLPEDRAMRRYAPGKWSVKEVVGHLCDSERVFSYRALRFGRGDATPLANFDENAYAETGAFDRRTVASLRSELRSLRVATLALFDGFDDAAWARSGIARGDRVSVRALAWVIAGHTRHHLDVLARRYGVS